MNHSLKNIELELSSFQNKYSLLYAGVFYSGFLLLLILYCVE